MSKLLHWQLQLIIIWQWNANPSGSEHKLNPKLWSLDAESWLLLHTYFKFGQWTQYDFIQLILKPKNITPEILNEFKNAIIGSINTQASMWEYKSHIT